MWRPVKVLVAVGGDRQAAVSGFSASGRWPVPSGRVVVLHTVLPPEFCRCVQQALDFVSHM